MTEAALSGNSALPIGYRKKIARDAAPPPKHAAGVLFVAPDGDVLLLRRGGKPGVDNYVGHWALPGGGGEEGEQPEDTARRETREETGADISDDTVPMKPLDYRVSPNGIGFHTFASPVKDKFVPKLNDEHNGYAWSSLDMLPRPLHPAVEATLRDQVGMADDMQPEDWTGLRDGFLKWTAEEEAEPEHATDSALFLALDRDSVREKDRDGRLRVAKTNISKANVCPYKGSEIPGWKELGLEPNRIYQMLRDPEELRKAAPSLNGVPLLRKHIPVSAVDHKPNDVIGSLGTDADFDGEYLTNSLFVNAQDSIDGIENGTKKEISAGYHYTPDMTPGNFRGTPHDGVMRDIAFNHATLVEDGRAGPDVVVGDSMENLMSKKPTRLAALTLGLTAAHCAPLLAMDAKLTLPKELFADITAKNFKDKKAALLSGVKLALDGKLRKGLALDASTGGLAKLLDALEGNAEGTDESVSEEQHKAMEAAAHGESELGIPKGVGEEFAKKDEKKAFDAEPAKAWMREKGATDEEISSMFPAPATDEDMDDEEKKKAEEAKKKEAADKTAKDAEMKDMVSKPAMDAALKKERENTIKEVRATEQGIRAALATVKVWGIEPPASMAFDSAHDVHRHALTALNVEDAATMPVEALLPVLKAQPKPGAVPLVRNGSTAPLAMDAAARNSLKEIAGVDLDRIGRA